MADLRQPPPPRWRVVERDRKLVVLDSRTGQTVTAAPAAAPASAPARSWLPQQIQFDGSAELTTHRFYDDKAPRTLRLDPGSAATLGRLKLTGIGAILLIALLAIAWPWLLLPIFFLWNNTVRSRLRAAATKWLDRVEREAG